MASKLLEKFTERAKLALSSAAKEAKTLESKQIETEHILLGILADESSVASKVLASFHVDSERMRESIFSSAQSQESSSESGFSDSSQEAIAAASLQSYLWGGSLVGTEHLLCGLAKTPSGLAYHVLRSWGISYDNLKSRISNYTPIQQPTTAKEPSTPLLNTYGSDITALAKARKLDPVISREAEISRVLQVLSRRTKNNPVLIGEAGVGKTAIVEGLAQKIASGAVPEKFLNSRLVSLDINAVVAGTRFRGDFEERLLGVIEEIKEAKNIILFIDEIQTIVGAGGAGGALDAANILKPALARGELRCIGATTAEEYTEFIEEDSALERRFQPIYVEEPDTKTAISILEGLKSRYEMHHGVRVQRGVVPYAVYLAKRYLVDRHLPDSAIDILDEAASKKSVSFGQLPPAAAKLGERLKRLKNQKEVSIKDEDWKQALTIREKEKEYTQRFEEIVVHQKGPQSAVVEGKDVAEVVSLITGVPVEELTRDEAQKLLHLEKKLTKKVIGQKDALNQVSAVLRRNRVGLRDPSRPIGSFIFLGTSGVGKTLVAETLAEVLFDDPDNIIRLNMSEFSEQHTVSRLVGAPPGYVGYEEGGELTERLRHRPYSVILLDEIEKAHSEVFNTLLQVLDNGQLLDGKGRKVNFRNSLIIMTSNVGSHLIKKEGEVGFIPKLDSSAGEKSHYKNISEKLTEELRRSFRVEFLNRLDSIIVFKPLSKTVAKKIAKLLVKEVSHRLKSEQNMELFAGSEIFDLVAQKGFSDEYGARQMRRVVTEIIEDPLSEGILSGNFKKGQKIAAKLEKDKVVVK